MSDAMVAVKGNVGRLGSSIGWWAGFISLGFFVNLILFFAMGYVTAWISYQLHLVLGEATKAALYSSFYGGIVFYCLLMIPFGALSVVLCSLISKKQRAKAAMVLAATGCVPWGLYSAFWFSECATSPLLPSAPAMTSLFIAPLLAVVLMFVAAFRLRRTANRVATA